MWLIRVLNCMTSPNPKYQVAVSRLWSNFIIVKTPAACCSLGAQSSILLLIANPGCLLLACSTHLHIFCSYSSGLLILSEYAWDSSSKRTYLPQKWFSVQKFGTSVCYLPVGMVFYILLHGLVFCIRSTTDHKNKNFPIWNPPLPYLWLNARSLWIKCQKWLLFRSSFKLA